MSGHSKWSTIKRDKEKTDAARGRIFSRIGKEIAIAVKMGGADPSSNNRLAGVIAKAKANNMPKENIQRNLIGAGSKTYEEFVYEGYGPGGSAFIVEVLTDNKNRAAAEIRHIFDRSGGALGTPNSVSYLFEKRAVVVVNETAGLTEDKLTEYALECNADDVREAGDVFVIYGRPSALQEIENFMHASKLEVVSAKVEMLPMSEMELDSAKYSSFEKMLEKLDEHEDVQEYYHNVKEKFC